MVNACIPSDFDICILGGGPAGTTLSLKLAVLGYRVCLIERSAFPRRQLGESLAPAVLDILGQIGLAGRMQAACRLAKTGAIVRWAGRTTTIEPTDAGFHVDRGRFDQVLMDEAVRAGVCVLQPAVCVSTKQCADGRWRLQINHGETPVNIGAEILAIACGRRSSHGRKVKRLSVPTLALYGYWRQGSCRAAQARVEAGDDAWYWAAPLPDGLVNAAVFVDPSDPALRQSKSLNLTYARLMQKSRLLSGLLDGTPVSQVAACDASTLAASPVVADRLIRLGDAAFCVDPLSSQGVLHAMVSALRSAVVINTILNRPENSAHAEMFYEQRQAAILRRDRKISGTYYSEQFDHRPTSFWKKRSEGGEADLAIRETPSIGELPLAAPLRLSDNTRVGRIPVVEQDIIAVRPALEHPALEHPIAYYRNVPAADLLSRLRNGATGHELLDAWRNELGPRYAWDFLSSMWSKGLIVQA